MSQNAETKWKLFLATDNTSDGVSGVVTLMNPLGGVRKTIRLDLTGPTAAAFNWFAGGAVWVTTTAVDAVQFLFASGNIASGTIRCYGVEK